MKQISKKTILRLISILFAVILTLSCTFTASAESIQDVPYTTYTYWDIYGGKSPVVTKATHNPVNAFNGEELGVGAFSEVQHLNTYKDTLYVLDSGNGRVVMFDTAYKSKGEIKDLTFNGEEIDFTGAKGVFADDSGVYICDTNNERVLYLKDGEIAKIITKPEDTTIPETFSFTPSRLVRDKSGYLYLLCEGSYFGMMVFSKDLEYFGFFGANNVKTSFSAAIKELILSVFETEEKHNASAKSLPFSLIDLCLDPEGFITAVNGETAGQMRRFGFDGTNTLTMDTEFNSKSSDGFNFADNPVMFRDKTNVWSVFYSSKFKSIAVDGEGYYYLVDDTHGRIFIYDEKCNIISVFGGGRQKGNQLGTFVSPSAVAVFGDDLLVSDFSTGEITVFERTDHGKRIMTAQSLTINSKYLDAKPHWEKVLKDDKGCQLAYRGLAKAALKEKNYSKAMEYAKTGIDREIYAQAFEKVRNDFISNNFLWISLLVVLLVGGLVWLITLSRKKNLVFIKNQKVRCVVNFPIHPLNNLYDIKHKNMGNFVGAIIVLALYYVSSILLKLEGGFMFSTVDLSNFNSLLVLLGSVGIVLLWTVSNWLVCILFEGKGRMKEIFYTTCYSLIPITVYNFLFIVLSNFLIPGANSPFELLGKICYIFTGILLLLSITVIHEFSFFKAIGTALATVLGMAIVTFILFAMLTLWQDMIAFVIGLFNEATLR